MNRIFFLILLIIFLSASLAGQKPLEPERYHIHRNTPGNAHLKFNRGNKARVAFLGGSITYNPGWRDSVCQYLQREFPATAFDFINAGIPSMGSVPGAFRFERDVLKNGPVDLLFLEAAVNDDTNRRTAEEIIRGMEGIVRHALRHNPYCDMVIMHFVDPGKIRDYRDGKIPEVIRLHEQVARHYGISSIHLAREVTERIDAGEFSWEDDFLDLHPSPFGQQVYFRSIIEFLDQAWKRSPQNEKPTRHNIPEFLDRHSFSNGVLVLPSHRQVTPGWRIEENWQPSFQAGTRDNYVNVPMLVGTYPGDTMAFNFIGNAVGMAVAAGPGAGMVAFRIDRGPWQIQDLFTPWSHQLYLPWYYTLTSGLESKQHTLEIWLMKEKHPESLGNECILRYFYYNATTQ
jgi:lysophospholipase L1-like esterase